LEKFRFGTILAFSQNGIVTLHLRLVHRTEELLCNQRAFVMG